MASDKAQKELKFIAIVSVVSGISGLIASAYYWFTLRSGNFSHLGGDEHAQAAISWLLLALKIFSFMILSGISIVMIILRWRILVFFKKVNERQ
ncbi:MAG TPA: hypothetical protein VGN23_13610 [Verrucomicrobiae bacterium]|jgi:hypothetical protein